MRKINMLMTPVKIIAIADNTIKITGIIVSPSHCQLRTKGVNTGHFVGLAQIITMILNIIFILFPSQIFRNSYHPNPFFIFGHCLGKTIPSVPFAQETNPGCTGCINSEYSFILIRMGPEILIRVISFDGFDGLLCHGGQNFICKYLYSLLDVSLTLTTHFPHFNK